VVLVVPSRAGPVEHQVELVAPVEHQVELVVPSREVLVAPRVAPVAHQVELVVLSREVLVEHQVELVVPSREVPVGLRGESGVPSWAAPAACFHHRFRHSFQFLQSQRVGWYCDVLETGITIVA
jgi:hypothetical protein